MGDTALTHMALLSSDGVQWNLHLTGESDEWGDRRRVVFTRWADGRREEMCALSARLLLEFLAVPATSEVR